MPALVGVIALVVLTTAGITGYARQQLTAPVAVPQPAVFEVTRGASLNTIVEELVTRGIVTAPGWLLQVYARLTASQGELKAGEYALERELNALTLLARLRAGDVLQRQITFPEGWRFVDWRAHLAEQDLITQTISDHDDEQVMAALGMAGVHPEGRFFPDTYDYVKGESDVSLLARAARKMNTALTEQWQLRLDDSLASPEEALILASIVEKETGYGPERGVIAGVFLNRLRDGIRLQTDPTVIYGATDYAGDLTRQHLREKTPYNTYQIKGLPPTPICNPGLAALQAVLQPEVTDYYYFVARGDGRSQFSKTLAEHNKAVARFQRDQRAADYRSTPAP